MGATLGDQWTAVSVGLSLSLVGLLGRGTLSSRAVPRKRSVSTLSNMVATERLFGISNVASTADKVKF